MPAGQLFPCFFERASIRRLESIGASVIETSSPVGQLFLELSSQLSLPHPLLEYRSHAFVLSASHVLSLPLCIRLAKRVRLADLKLKTKNVVDIIASAVGFTPSKLAAAVHVKPVYISTEYSKANLAC